MLKITRCLRPSYHWLVALLLGTALALPVLNGACAPAADGGAGFQEPKAEDFSALPWGEAFQRLNEKLSREYAFTDWKGISWPALYAQYAPRIARAETAKDLKSYYLALREYVYALPDGHVNISGNEQGIPEALYGGGFGLVPAHLDDGRVVASWVDARGPAAAAGIAAGAEIIHWDGKPVGAVLRETSILFGAIAPTSSRADYERLRFLVRAPVGDQRQVLYRNPGAKEDRSVFLKAADDRLDSLLRTDQRSLVSRYGMPDHTIEAKLLPGNVGYLAVIGEFDLPDTVPGDHTPTLKQFRETVNGFIDRPVNGIILDIRGNSGGSDAMAAAMLGSFYANRTFYEYQTWFNALTGRLERRLQDEVSGQYVAGGDALYIEPQAKYYTGPVIALVDNACISSGEGLALGIRNLNHGRVAGFTGTNGSFGMAGDSAVMPGGFRVGFPWGQSLDQGGNVQLDSRHGVGGVPPNLRVPMTLENAVRAAAGQDVVLEYALKAVDEMRRGGYR
jgi:carboxyl-terminal processing protease